MKDENMILRPLLNSSLPKSTWLVQSRSLRPIIRIGKEKFEISIDVHQFEYDELRVKARPEYVVIQGKQERQTKTGYVIRQFRRKFKLPPGCDPNAMRSELSKDGILTVVAKIKTCEVNLPCEQTIRVKKTGDTRGNDEGGFIKVDDGNQFTSCGSFQSSPGEKQLTIQGDPDKDKGGQKK